MKEPGAVKTDSVTMIGEKLELKLTKTDVKTDWVATIGGALEPEARKTDWVTKLESLVGVQCHYPK